MRVLVDTNVWRYLATRGEVNALARESRRQQLEILVAPAVVYELLAVEDGQLRRTGIEAVTRQRWARLMPDLYLECADLVAAIRRHQPAWVRHDPDLASFNRQRADWIGKGGFWGRTRADPATKARIIDTLQGHVLLRARAQTRDLRDEMRALDFATVSVEDVAVHVPGWGDRGVPEWRYHGAARWWDGLWGHGAKAYLDWCAPFIDISRIRQAGRAWQEFWFDHVAETDVPRDWLRWATRRLQGTRKVTPGTPGDNQLAVYLPDADALVTADKAFFDIVGRLRQTSPIPLARPVRIKPEGDLIEQILKANPRAGS